MGASAGFVGLGLDIAAALRLGRGASGGAVLIDADFEHDRYAYAGVLHTSEAAFLAAVGGARADGMLTIGPAVVGDELMPNPGFALDDATGWAPNAGTETASFGVADGKLNVTVSSPTDGQSRWGCPLSLTADRAYRIGARPTAAWDPGSAFISFDRELMFTEVTQVAPPLAAGEQRFAFGAAEAATMYLGAHTVGPGSRVEVWDDFTVREAVPVVGHDPAVLAGRIEATTPAAAADMVLFQADDNGTLGGDAAPSQRNRLRLGWGADGRLRFVVTRGGVEQAALDLGPLAPSTRFTVLFSAAADDFRTSRDGRDLQHASSGAMPGLAVYRLGGAGTGEAWGGSIARLTLLAGGIDDAGMTSPRESIAVFGDSTAAGDGVDAEEKWHALLAAGYTPARNLYNAGVGGENTEQLLARVAADTAHRRWTTIFVDRPNANAEPWIGNLKAAVALLETDRWFVLPPVLNSPSGQPDETAAGIADAQAALLADPFFAGHTLDPTAQAAYIAAMNDDAMRVGDTDFVHFGPAGQALQATTIRTFLDTRHW